MRFRLRDGCPLWCVVPHASTITRFSDFRRIGHDPDQADWPGKPGMVAPGFGMVDAVVEAKPSAEAPAKAA